MLFSLLGTAGLTGCKKGYDNAQLCLVNGASDTVNYGRNQNYYDQSLTPGETACEDAGEIKTGLLTSNTSTWLLESGHGDHFVEVDECYEEFVID